MVRSQHSSNNLVECQDGQNNVEDEVEANKKKVDDVKGEGDEVTDRVDYVMEDEEDKVEQHEENVEGNFAEQQSKNFENKTAIRVIQLVF